jgi:maintenance of morphology protein 1
MPPFPPSSQFKRLPQVLDAYRSKLRDDLDGPDGDEIVRKRVEELANKMRPISVLVSPNTPNAHPSHSSHPCQDPIKIHAVDLGASSPRLSNARRATAQGAEPNVRRCHSTWTVSLTPLTRP